MEEFRSIDGNYGSITHRPRQAGQWKAHRDPRSVRCVDAGLKHTVRLRQHRFHIPHVPVKDVFTLDPLESGRCESGLRHDEEMPLVLVDIVMNSQLLL